MAKVNRPKWPMSSSPFERFKQVDHPRALPQIFNGRALYSFQIAPLRVRPAPTKTTAKNAAAK
jgi:hypothetical protein